ncbi:MAG: S-layer homology domain-containing protein [Atopobiaceae bacterium]|nr:S-layer homology domain-containing protein [Atopobiaceae bacterium]
MFHPPKHLAAATLALLSALCLPTPALAEGGLPSRFDLRDRGVVTPVKQQEPWGDCWAHAAIAASETSILSAMGSTYAQTGLDLSERHLAWYVVQPVTESVSKSQAGEGLRVYNTAAGANHVYDFGGREQCAATLFAQGIGPMPEQEYPNQGAEGRLAFADLKANKEAYITQKIAAYRDIYWYYDDDTLRTLAEEDYKTYLERYKTFDAYSPLDDWSINEQDGPGSGRFKGSPYTLTHNNVLTYWARPEDDGSLGADEKYDGEPIYTHNGYALYQGSIDLLKSELYAGRGISVGLTITNKGLDRNTWSEYNSEHTLSPDHVCCIVGWDDDYAASNFKGEDGAPPSKGAWIVKNSWGSETDLVPGGLVAADGSTKDAHAGDWGIVDENGKHTGYFYLSYYDRSIAVPESFDFRIEENNDQQDALQLDYLPASYAEWFHADDRPEWEANVFTLDKDMRIDEVATRIRMSDKVPVQGFTCTFDLYRLRNGATRPDDGEHLATCTREFETQGYHRAKLDAPVYLKAGDRLGIVVQQSHTFADGTARYCIDAQETDGYRERHTGPVYGTPVLNEGESYWKLEGITNSEETSQEGWLDMTAPLTKNMLLYLKPDLAKNSDMLDFYVKRYAGKPIKDFFNVDNFCIKAFGEPGAEQATFTDVSEQTAHAGDISWLASTGISEGWKHDDGRAEFRPYAQVARADMAAFLFRLARNWGLVDDSWVPTGSKSFTDVNEQTAHYREIVWLAESGISEGWKHKDGTAEFRPYESVARADMAAFIARLHLLSGGTAGGQGNFTDVSNKTAHAVEIRWLAAAGISEGWKHDDGTAEFRPYAFVARADMAAFLHRLHEFKQGGHEAGQNELEIGQAVEIG